MRIQNRSMSNLCNQISILSNFAKIVENESSYKLSPLLLNKPECQSVKSNSKK